MRLIPTDLQQFFRPHAAQKRFEVAVRRGSSVPSGVTRRRAQANAASCFREPRLSAGTSLQPLPVRNHPVPRRHRFSPDGRDHARRIAPVVPWIAAGVCEWGTIDWIPAISATGLSRPSVRANIQARVTSSSLKRQQRVAAGCFTRRGAAKSERIRAARRVEPAYVFTPGSLLEISPARTRPDQG